jgi:hypothetical protein
VAPKFRPGKIARALATQSFDWEIIYPRLARRELRSTWLDRLRWTQGIVGPVFIALLAITFSGVLRRETG